MNRTVCTSALATWVLLAPAGWGQVSQQNHVAFIELDSYNSAPGGPHEWPVVDSSPPNNPSVSASDGREGNNSFLTIRQALLPGYFGSAARIAAGDHVWRPALDGPVDAFSFRLTMRVDLPEPVVGVASPPVGVSVALIVRQGPTRFRSLQNAVWRSGFAPENSFLPFPALTVDPEGFRDLDGSDARPDFGLTAPELRFGFEITVSLPTPTEATYVVDLDDIVVTALRSQDLPPGVAFDPRAVPGGATVLSDGTLYRVAIRPPNGLGINPSRMIRVGDPALALRAHGSARVVVRGVPEQESGWASDFPAGVREITVEPGHVEASFCSYVHELTLESVDGGRVYSPARTALLLLPRDSASDCFFDRLAHVLTLAVACGEGLASLAAVAPAAPGDDLDTLRAFRDDVMAASAAGRYYRDLYATHSTAAVRAVLQRPKLVFDLARAWEPWVAGAAAMVAGNGASASVTPSMLADLREVLDGFKTAGAPAFSRAVSQEEERLGIATWAGLSFAQVWQRVQATAVPTSCAPDAHSLCLNGGRYRVEADWRKPDGERGRARAVSLTGASGYFWFFDPTNVEILTKVLDGCGVNDHTWSFSAGLTNLEVDLFVQDTLTGLGKHYNNAAGTSFPTILDTEAIACTAAPPPAPLVAHPPIASPDRASVAKGTCVDTPTTLCLDGGRFAVEASWALANGSTGPAFAAPLTDNTGTFWFFREDNVELVVKVLDACSLAAAPRYWVFAGGTTNVGVELRVLDTVTGVERRYQREAGAPFNPILDTDAFATCTP